MKKLSAVLLSASIVLLGFGAPATMAFADNTTTTPDGCVTTTIVIKEATSEKVITTAYQPAVYETVVTPAVPATYVLEYQYKQHQTGKLKWEKAGWNAGYNGKGWSATGLTRNTDKVLTPAVPESSKEVLVSPEVLEVSHTVDTPAVTESTTVCPTEEPTEGPTQEPTEEPTEPVTPEPSETEAPEVPPTTVAPEPTVPTTEPATDTPEPELIVVTPVAPGLIPATCENPRGELVLKDQPVGVNPVPVYSKLVGNPGQSPSYTVIYGPSSDKYTVVDNEFSIPVNVPVCPTPAPTETASPDVTPTPTETTSPAATPTPSETSPAAVVTTPSAPTVNPAVVVTTNKSVAKAAPVVAKAASSTGLAATGSTSLVFLISGGLALALGLVALTTTRRKGSHS